MSELRRHIMMRQGGSAESYTFVEYLQGYGEEYIVIPYDNQYIDFEIHFSTWPAGPTMYNSVMVKHGLTKLLLITQIAGVSLTYNNAAIGRIAWLGGVAELRYDARVNTYNNVMNTSGSVTIVSDNPYNFISQSDTDIYLFGDGNKDTWNMMNGITIYDENGVVFKDFKAARRDSDGELGVYCQETGEFYFNSGTGSFTAGPDIN